MKKLTYGLILIVFVVAAIIVWEFFLTESVSFDPNWKDGMTWKVSAVNNAQGGGDSTPSHATWKFKIIDRAVINDRTVYSIKATRDKAKSGNQYILKFAYPNLSLISVALYRSNRLINEVKPNLPFFILKESPLPMDFSPLPTFNLTKLQKNQDLSLKKSIPLGGGRYKVNQLSKFSQEIIVNRSIRKLTVLLTAQFGNDRIQNLQTWEAGKPWWTGSKRFRNGKLESEAILLED